jgi:uncharacterized lipoprotein YmbA
MAPRQLLGRAALVPVLMMLAVGCGLLRGPEMTPTTFYVLSGTSTAGEIPAGRAMVLGLGPVSFPGYLGRPQMVTRVAPNELIFDEFNRWSEPLKQNFEDSFGSNIDRLIGVKRLIPFPWYANTKLDYSITVNVLRFEPQPDRTVILDARWSIRNPQSDVLVDREVRYSRPSGTPADNAAAMSSMTGDLARDIAVALRDQDAKRPR